jgi:RNA polymerase sigma-70 factor (ECF subfamily)
MLGSLSDADDAVQEAWLRLSRSDISSVENLGGWLTTVVARVCLSMLQARKARPEQSLDGVQLPDPIVSGEDRLDPEQEVLFADSVGLALLVVLETLTPPQRLAFVLHDMFAVPFDAIASIVGSSPTAARQLASRARRRVQGAPIPDPDLSHQREIVDAFLAASRAGDFEALLQVLDPDVILRADRAVAAGASREMRGAAAVAAQALAYSRFAPFARPALVNGAAGLVVTPQGQRSRSWASSSRATRSSRSTYSPIPPACASLIWRSSATKRFPTRPVFATLADRGPSPADLLILTGTRGDPD